MSKFSIGYIELSDENKKFYNQDGYTMTGQTLKEVVSGYDLPDEETTYIVFKGKYTRSLTVRDCGDHFIIARHSQYDRVNKDDLSIIYDVEDI